MKNLQFSIVNNKLKVVFAAACTTCLFFANTALAQLADDDAINALKSDLQSSWSKSDSSNPKDLSAAVKDDSKKTLEQQEQALLQKLQGKTETVKGNAGSLRDESLIAIEDNSNLKVDEKPAQKPEPKIQIIQDQEEAASLQKAAAVSPTPKTASTSPSQINSSQAKKISELEAKLRERNKELEETRARLLLAETQVERLSSIIEKSNKQQMAGYLGEQPKSVQPAKVTQAVNIGKATSQEDTLIGVVSAAKAYLRSGPSTNDSPIMTVSRGTRLVVETRNEGWYRVITPTGSRAWISTDMLKFGPGTETGSGSSVRISGYDSKRK